MNKGRIIDGAMAFGRSEAIRVDAARLVLPPEVKQIHEDDHARLGEVLPCCAPCDHFPVRTELTLTYLREG